ncbi:MULTISPECIES: acyl carrier protein [Streptomyces]|uniref:Acyl carrier protein n=2 Tax=Streptomyces TaxID=1883 RepID=A0ABT9KSD4_9ACTN|nr:MULTISPECIES: acyl carrier protein [Streptomyces]ABC42546.1 putative acyl carrier protein [Streptomyces hygroscopicus]MBW8086522.1 acyl carrier protein [Streptomyces hygroscopicus subsp. hygroscopicus]MCO8306005.1 acyl carrier protein [Streptomyces sp. RKCA744]MDN3057175.1 acyl carrier protein [Streptomyces sp. SRF1]MDP9611333.1 acyl carrier protein [Streptomyces demainii]
MDSHQKLLALVRSKLAHQLQEEASLPWLADTDPLAPAGVDSVLLITVVGELEQELGVTLPDDAVLESASISSLATALDRGDPR